MSDKAFEYRLGRWFETPDFEATFTLKENTDLKKLNIEILLLISNYVELTQVETKKRATP